VIEPKPTLDDYYTSWLMLPNSNGLFITAYSSVAKQRFWRRAL